MKPFLDIFKPLWARSLLSNQDDLRFGSSTYISHLGHRFWRTHNDLSRHGYGELWAWSQSAAISWLDIYEPWYLPTDYLDCMERLLAEARNKERNDSRWGLEIGIRYFPLRDSLPPRPVKDVDLFMILNNIGNKLEFPGYLLLELVLAGGPEAFQKGVSWIRKHSVIDTKLDKTILYTRPFSKTIQTIPVVTLKKLEAFWNSTERIKIEQAVFRLFNNDALQRRQNTSSL